MTTAEGIRVLTGELAELVDRHPEVPAGAVGLALVTAFAATLARVKGSTPTLAEFERATRVLADRLVGAGLVARNSPGQA